MGRPRKNQSTSTLNTKSLEDLANEFLGDDFQKPEHAHTFKGELPPQAKLEQGDQCTGYFTGMKTIEITDQNTGEPKPVRVYGFKTKSDSTFAVLGRSALDQAMDNAATKAGGWDRLINMVVRINRLEDSKLKGGRVLGNYLVTTWEERKR